MPRRKDLGSSLRGLVRCPRHNKTFDLQTGESPGNCEILQTFPCRFQDGCFYVRVPTAELSRASIDVDMEASPQPSPLKRSFGFTLGE
eukprot:g31402.t1